MTEHRPWFRSYPAGVPATCEPYPDMSVHAMLERSARRWPKRSAIAFLGRHLTYARLASEVERFSAALASLGVRRGDRVGLVLPNCPQYVIAYYAAARLGAIVVGNNPLYSRRELAHQLADAGCKVVVVLDQLYESVDALREEAGLEHLVVAKLTDYMRFPLNVLAPLRFRKEAKKEGKPWPPVPPDADVSWWRALLKAAPAADPPVNVDAGREVAGLIYTGGTTGLSKGAMLTHRNIVSNCVQSAAWFPDLSDGHDAIMCVLPFFHSYGMTIGMNLGIYRAAKLVLVPRFDLHRVLKEVQKERPTLFPGVPRIYIAINEAEESRTFDLRSIKACLSGAGSLPVAVAQKFHELTGAVVVEGYGLTETSPVTHANPLDGRAKPGAIGLPIPDTDCKIVDLEDPERVVEGGEPGELAIRGPQVMLGYWNRPEETALAIRNGWFYTGDIASMDDAGYFSIVDRKKDMIKVSGFNVYPNDVEQVLYHHPKIQKVCVLGVPDGEGGELVKAYVVLRDPGEDTEQAEAELVAWCRDPDTGLAHYRVPKRWEFRDSLPETLVGKVLRRVLLEEEKQKAGTPAS